MATLVSRSLTRCSPVCVQELYLVTSAGFLPRYLACLFAMAACGFGCYRDGECSLQMNSAYQQVTHQMMAGAHKLEWWSVIGLLSSSCCALQILLHCFQLGCAGLNKFLGPLRPLFLALTTALQGTMWAVAYYKVPFARARVPQQPLTTSASAAAALPAQGGAGRFRVHARADLPARGAERARQPLRARGGGGRRRVCQGPKGRQRGQRAGCAVAQPAHHVLHLLRDHRAGRDTPTAL